ncbi:MAG: ATP-dependent DNA ligase, partial [Candidatus Eisenbacteria bacterium]|nr:ATP-dependent DNA ligase [Candidatus Eisenbacteria bacterium]
MEAISVSRIPEEDGWQYEPKWDGFRCLAFRDGEEIYLQSQAQKPLARYFPDVAAAMLGLGPKRFVVDGELVIPIGGKLSFEELQLRLHPAASRVAKLAAAHPARMILFDLLVGERGASLLDMPLETRRARLEAFAAKHLAGSRSILLSPASRAIEAGRAWFSGAGGNLDGVVAKRLDAPYRAGERDAVVKVKLLRTADCVVGGFRWHRKGTEIGSLLLGLYADDGLLHHVGYTSSLTNEERRALSPKLMALHGPPGFTGGGPGGPSRWSRDRESDEWEPVRPELVVEVRYDHFTGGRFRHGTQLLRWRPDKAPEQCTFEQVARPGAALSALLRG